MQRIVDLNTILQILKNHFNTGYDVQYSILPNRLHDKNQQNKPNLAKTFIVKTYT